MTRLPTDALTDLLAQLVRSEELGWDQPPRILSIALEEDAVMLRELPVPSVLWELDRAPVVLQRIADQVEAHPLLACQMINRFSIGIAFLCEMNAVMPEAGASEEELDKLLEVAAQHRLVDHPEAREMRTICAVDAASNRYMIMYGREGGEVIPLVKRPYGQPNHVLDGVVVDALQKIMSAVGADRVN